MNQECAHEIVWEVVCVVERTDRGEAGVERGTVVKARGSSRHSLFPLYDHTGGDLLVAASLTMASTRPTMGL